MTNMKTNGILSLALACLLSGVAGAQSPSSESRAEPEPGGTERDDEAAPNKGVQALDFEAQDAHPAPNVVLAVLPAHSSGASSQLLLQGGQPGQWLRVDFEGPGAGTSIPTAPVGWARFDGSGQARIDLGRRARPAGRFLCWCLGMGDSWWPGPQLTVAAAPSANIAATQMRPVQSGEMVISEIMKDPAAVPDSSGEWVELFNTTWMRQDIEGYTLTDDAGGGTVLTNGGNHVWVLGRGYRVLARNGDPALNGGIVGAHDYGTFSLRNGADQVILAKPDGTVVDRVSYDDGVTWPDPRGKSMQLSPGIESPYQNDSGGFWCEAVSSYGLGDLGTPGLVNDDC